MNKETKKIKELTIMAKRAVNDREFWFNKSSEKSNKIGDLEIKMQEQDEKTANLNMKLNNVLQSQVEWLRDLVEQLVIKPEVINARGKNARRIQEMEIRMSGAAKRNVDFMIPDPRKSTGDKYY